MFKFLKDKLKKSISKISKDIEEKGEEEIIEEAVEKPEVKEESKEVEEVKTEASEGKEETKEDVKEEPKPEEVKEELVEEEKPKKKGFFGKIFGKKKEVSEEEFEEVPKESVKKEYDIEEGSVEEKKETEEEKEKAVSEKEEGVEVKEEVKKEEQEKEVEQEKQEEVEERPFEEEKPEKIIEDVFSRPEEEKEVEQEPEKKEVEEPKKEIPPEEDIPGKENEEEKPEVQEEVREEEPEEAEVEEKIVKKEGQPKEETKPEKKGFFGKIREKIVTKKINEKQFEELFWELELGLLENNVAVEVIEKIKNDLQKNLIDIPLRRGQIEGTIRRSLKDSISEIIEVETIDIMAKIKEKKPYIVCFVGINGSGKTTSIAKVAHMLKENGLSVVLAAADTFRAAAIDQLGLHANRLGIKMIKHDYGSDPAAVAYDAIQHAKSKSIDVVLIDTAGRMHSNSNLTDEMKKIVRVASPDLKIFVGESITGNDCVEQARKFNEAIGIDAIILSKADIDEKGGAAVSVSYITGKPIIYIGVGQEYPDLKKFDSKIVVESIGL